MRRRRLLRLEHHLGRAADELGHVVEPRREGPDAGRRGTELDDEVAETIRAALKFVAPEKLYPCTNCGMAPMRREIAYGKLAALAAGAHLVRTELKRG